MYSIKEKNKHLRDLHAAQHVSSDLELLEKLDPRNDQLPSFLLAPERHSERILYVLLDIATAEQIRENRRATEIKKEKAAAKKAESEKVKELKEQLSDTELERDEAIDEKEELEEQVSDLKTKVGELESELEAEKKSPEEVKTNPPKDKKKTSFPKSTGKTSRTKTSR